MFRFIRFIAILRESPSPEIRRDKNSVGVSLASKWKYRTHLPYMHEESKQRMTVAQSGGEGRGKRKDKLNKCCKHVTDTRAHGCRRGGWILIISGLGHVSTVPRKTKPEETTSRALQRTNPRDCIHKELRAAPPRIFLNAAIFIIPPAAYGLRKRARKLRLRLVKAQIVSSLEQGRSNIAGYRSSGIKAIPKDFQVREMIRDDCQDYHIVT